MKTSTRFQPSAPTGLLATLAVAAFLFAGCPQAEQAGVVDDAASAAAEARTAIEAETRAIEERLQEAAAAQAAATEAAQQALAEREALLELREEHLRKEEALRLEEARDAKRSAQLSERERSLAAREKELENFEANLVFQERELQNREAELDEANAVGGPAVGETGDLDFGDESDLREPVETELGEDESIEPATEFLQATIEPGRLLEVEFEETVSSATHRRGDTFSGSLVQDLTAEDGTLVVAAGAEVIGRVTQVTPLKRVGGRASIEVEFTHLILSPTETIAISASFVEVGADKRKDKKRIAGAAIVGAILGRVLGGDGAEGVLAGAAAGAAVGTAAVARAKGKDAELPAGQIVALQLEEVVTVEVEMTGLVDG